MSIVDRATTPAARLNGSLTALYLGFLRDPLLVGLGVVTTLIAVAAAIVHATTDTAAGTVAGTGIGALPLAYAVFRLVASWAQRPAAEPANR